MARLTEEEKDFLVRAEDAIARGNVFAMIDWANFYINDHPELITDKIAGHIVDYYEKGVSEEISAAYLNMGSLYYSGHLVKQDYDTALSYYEIASNSPDDEVSAIAYTNMGYYYLHQNPNPRRALSCFMSACARGDADAAYKLGDMLSKGIGVDCDLTAAYKMYETAVKLCRDDTTFGCILTRLGECRYYGWGCEKDLQNAILDLTRAEGYLMKSVMKKEAFAEERLTRLEIVLNKIKKDFSKETNNTLVTSGKLRQLSLNDGKLN